MQDEALQLLLLQWLQGSGRQMQREHRAGEFSGQRKQRAQRAGECSGRRKRRDQRLGKYCRFDEVAAT